MADCCDKCDGAHATDACPYYPQPRFRHLADDDRFQERMAKKNKNECDSVLVTRSQLFSFNVPTASAQESNKAVDEATEYLSSLTQSERDTILKDIEYVDQPMHHLQCVGIDIFEEASAVVNYTQFFGNLADPLVNKFSIPSPLGKNPYNFM